MKKNYLLTVILSALLWSCDIQNEVIEEPNSIIESESSVLIVGEIDADVEVSNGTDTNESNQRISAFTETFENVSKPAFAAANVNLNSGTYNMTDALIGTLSSDRRFGSRSARVRNNGFVIMLFNMESGVSQVRVSHARFGNDNNSTWRFIISYDNGASWLFAGNTITTSSTSLQSVTLTMNDSRPARLGLYKTGGGSNRINFDNFEVTPFTSTSSTASRDSHLTFGNPSDAGLTSGNNYLVSRNEYALSYNNSRGTASWVSWHLSTAWLGSAPRSDNFRIDTSLPSNFFRASTSDYTNSGFDRGHICPSADRTFTSTANSNTFFMTNIAPQAPRNNQIAWARLEDYSRDLAEDGFELHIIAGIAGNGGEGRNGFANSIDGGNIDVPNSFWKVILILPNGTNDVNRVTTGTRVIAVNIPNNQSISTNWGIYRTSVDAIESLTGLNLLENIPNSLESTLESRVDNGPTS